MPYSTWMLAVVESVVSAGQAEVRTRLSGLVVRVLGLIAELLRQPVTPATWFDFEQKLAAVLRDTGREITEWVANGLEADAPAVVQPAGGGQWRRRSDKTPNRQVATLFGKIVLWRHAYRANGEACLFPLEESLGLVEGCTPAFAERATWLMAQAGATQRLVLERLKRDHAVTLGANRLRKLCEGVARALTPRRREFQTARVCDLLRQASGSTGRHKPVLAVGRDGITVGHTSGGFEVASCATMSVLDRRGKRLGTVCLGFAPEAGQQTMTRELKSLILSVLSAWDGPPPRLCYVSDAGDSESSFYKHHLHRMRDPRRGGRLKWQRIVDFYHAAERISTLAECLNLSPTKAREWSMRMRRVLKEPHGVSRVLHSAAALKKRHGLRSGRAAAYRTAIGYLRTRRRWMRYADFRRLGLPIGSGVTEGCCKTLFTARVKQSGMRWSHTGLQTLLDLRMLTLSDIWDAIYADSLNASDHLLLTIPTTTPRPVTPKPLCNAA
ncbi:MAG TPA: hypothetical protein VK137_11620 [Planctomycetaceae bacterium]|nr:hypothetical protein [Planctomycetaceae bacterium]